MSLAATFHEAQFVDSGNGKDFGLQVTIPAPVTYGDPANPIVKRGDSLPLYNNQGQMAPAGKYWLIIDDKGTPTVLGLNERAVADLGDYGLFRKQNGVAFVSPRSERDCAFAFVYEAK